MTTATAPSILNSTRKAAQEWPSLIPFDATVPHTHADLLARVRGLEEHRAACLKAYARLLEDFEHAQALCHEMLGIPKR